MAAEMLDIMMAPAPCALATAATEPAAPLSLLARQHAGHLRL
jgi:hypothetical protein